MEMYIVHKIDGGPEWEKYKQSLAVIGILFVESEKSHPFVERLHIEDMGRIDYINLKKLFNEFHSHNFSYELDSEDTHNFYHY